MLHAHKGNSFDVVTTIIPQEDKTAHALVTILAGKPFEGFVQSVDLRHLLQVGMAVSS